MSRRFLIWCADPCHEDILPNGKRRCWKTGPKPTHPLGQRSINKELADFIKVPENRNSSKIFFCRFFSTAE